MFVGRSLNGRVVSLLNDDALMASHNQQHPIHHHHHLQQQLAYPASQDPAQQPQPARVEKKRNHICATCNKAFTTSGHLARHIRVHTGERNHKCPFPGCDTRCSRQDNLQQHFRIHLSPRSRRSSQAKRASNPASVTSVTADRAVPRKPKAKQRDREIYTPTPPASPTGIHNGIQNGSSTSPSASPAVTLHLPQERNPVKTEETTDTNYRPRPQYASPPPDTFANPAYPNPTTDAPVVLFDPTDYPPHHRDSFIHNTTLSPTTSSGVPSSYPSPVSASSSMTSTRDVQQQQQQSPYASSSSSPASSVVEDHSGVIMLQPAPQPPRYYLPHHHGQYTDFPESAHPRNGPSSSFGSYQLPPLSAVPLPPQTPVSRSPLPPIQTPYHHDASSQYPSQSEYVEQGSPSYPASQATYRGYHSGIDGQQVYQGTYAPAGYADPTYQHHHPDQQHHAPQQQHIHYHHQPQVVQSGWR